ncbi:hypothetical protein MKX54_19625 [Alkalihalobacillus sp. FSL R5-0424]
MVAVQSGHYSVQNAEIYIPSSTIQQWYQGLKQMHRELKGMVVLTNRDNSLFLKVTTQTLGQLHVEGTIQELPSVENQLTFEFQLDQSYLPRVIEELKIVVE